MSGTAGRYCAQCGGGVPGGARFCPACGRPTPVSPAGRRGLFVGVAVAVAVLLVAAGGWLWLGGVLSGWGGGGSREPAVVVVDGRTPSPEPSPTATATATAIVLPTATATPSTVAPPSVAPPPTVTARPTATAGATPVATATATATAAADSVVLTPEALERRVVVSAGAPWTDTGIDLSAGDEVTVTYVAGAWRAGPLPTWPWVGPDGDPQVASKATFPVPAARIMALVGRVGDGVPFYVGLERRWVVAGVGRLWLGVNDDGFEDNRGSAEVVVVRQ